MCGGALTPGAPLVTLDWNSCGRERQPAPAQLKCAPLAWCLLVSVETYNDQGSSLELLAAGRVQYL